MLTGEHPKLPLITEHKARDRKISHRFGGNLPQIRWSRESLHEKRKHIQERPVWSGRVCQVDHDRNGHSAGAGPQGRSRDQLFEKVWREQCWKLAQDAVQTAQEAGVARLRGWTAEDACEDERDDDQDEGGWERRIEGDPRDREAAERRWVRVAKKLAWWAKDTDRQSAQATQQATGAERGDPRLYLAELTRPGEQEPREAELVGPDQR